MPESRGERGRWTSDGDAAVSAASTLDEIGNTWARSSVTMAEMGLCSSFSCPASSADGDGDGDGEGEGDGEGAASRGSGGSLAPGRGDADGGRGDSVLARESVGDLVGVFETGPADLLLRRFGGGVGSGLLPRDALRTRTGLGALAAAGSEGTEAGAAEAFDEPGGDFGARNSSKSSSSGFNMVKSMVCVIA